jgi:hypothetical protein
MFMIETAVVHTLLQFMLRHTSSCFTGTRNYPYVYTYSVKRQIIIFRYLFTYFYI